jgi:hypothetical protein
MRIRIWPWASTLIVVGCAACSASDPASTQHPVGTLDKSVPSIADGAASGSGVGASPVAGTAAVSVGASGTSAPSIAGGPAKPPATTPNAIAGIGGGNPVPAAGAVAPPPAATGGAVASEPATPHDTKTCLKAGPGSYAEPGPYKVAMMDVDLGMIEASQHTGKFTIFYPMPLETSCLHPIVAWGNGTTVKDSTTYAFFNSNAASWGMVVIASQEDNAGSGNFHKAGIDYLLKQNGDASSMFYKKLSTRAGVAGHSQGGFGANAGSQHPNVEALVSVAGGGVPKAKVATLCLTGTKDMVEAGCTAQYNAATGSAFLADWMDGDHFTTETLAGYITRDPGSLQMQRLLAAWFRCFLADDQDACALFKGAPTNCGICKDTGWAKHESHNL